MSEIMKKLQAPFPPDSIEWRVGRTNKDKTKGLALAYITNRAIQARLDEVFGCFGWQNEFRDWGEKSQLCGISVYDTEKKEWVTKWDGADNSDFEATKGGLSDSMKRAAVQWGIGRYLYNMPAVWMPVEQRGKSCYLTNTPKLPAWALPEGYTGKQETSLPPLPPEEAKPQAQKTTQREKQQAATCADCKTPIKPAIVTFSERKYGRPLCLDCQGKVKSA